MTNNLISSTDSIDLSNCDKELIHLSGKIQVNGHLLSITKKDYKITYVSVGIEEVFGLQTNDLFQKRIYDLFTESFIDSLKVFIKGEQNSIIHEKPVMINKRNYQIFLSDGGEFVHLEIQLIPDSTEYEQDTMNCFLFFTKLINSLENMENENQLVNMIALILREFTDYDRTMVYKFDNEGNGEVVAEDKFMGLDSFLGLKYPASDIPAQARLLYLKNKSRSIFDVNDEGKSIISANGNAAKNFLDLGNCMFRSVSPIHLQYLKNMGVNATHAVSIVIDKRLWGMLICHQYSGPKLLSMNKRLYLQIFGDTISNRIAILNRKLDKDKNELLNEITSNLKNISSTLEESIWSLRSEICELFNCQELSFNNSQIGNIQIPDFIYQTLNNKMNTENNSVTHSFSLLKDFGIKKDSISYEGVMRVEIAKDKNEFLYLWRIGKKKTVNWAGNPNKPVEVEANDLKSLSPRKSFEKWQMVVDGESEEWTEKEIQTGYLIRNIILEFKINQFKTLQLDSDIELKALIERKNEELEKANLLLKEELQKKDEYTKNLLATKQSLEQLSKAKTDLLGNISHEMKTPLHGIIGLSELIRNNPISQQVEKYIDLQLKSAERLLATVNRFLEIGLTEYRDYNVKFEKINISKLFSEEYNILKLQAETKKIEVYFIIHQKEVHSTSDVYLLKQIFTNLFSNAIKFTPENGRVEINLKTIIEKNVELLQLSFEDNGIGIENGNFEKIFEKFFMENSGLKQSDNSTGLGLSLVKNYVNILGGQVTINSEKGKGSLFTVKIPLRN